MDIECSKCGVSKAREAFRKGRRQCKQCCRERQNKIDQKNAEHIRQRKQKWYQANFEKEMARMYKYRADNLDRLNEKNRERYARDPQRILQANNKWRAKNPDHQKQYYAAHAKEFVEYARQRRAANPERTAEYNKRFYAENAEHRKANTRRWAKANPEKTKNQVRRRRARKRAAEGSHTLAQWRALVDRFQGYCLRCRKYFGIAELTEDHVVPLTKGGSDAIENIQPLCHSCNSSKGSRHSTDFRKNWEPAT